MSYKLKKIHVKLDGEDWSHIVFDVITALDTTPDDRDSLNKETINPRARPEKFKWFSEIKHTLGESYIGWNREYVGNDQFHMIYYFTTEEAARQFYEEASAKQLTHEGYMVQWQLLNDTDNELEV
jgi:hypothetical protein